MVGPFKFLSMFVFKGVRREVRTELRSEKVRRYIVSNPYHAVSISIPLSGGVQGCTRYPRRAVSFGGRTHAALERLRPVEVRLLLQTPR